MAVTRFRCHSGHFSILGFFSDYRSTLRGFILVVFFFFFPVCFLTRIANKLLSEPLDRWIFSPILLLLASFGTVCVVLLKSDYWWATEAKVAVSFWGVWVWLSECLTLDSCNHGHVYEKSPFWDSCVCFPCGYICEMHFNLYVGLPIIFVLKCFCDLAVL